MKAAVPRPLLVGLFVTLALGGIREGTSAQVVRGRLWDRTMDTPVVNGPVALLDSLGRVVDRSLSDAEGAFRLRAPVAGSYRVQAAGMGYATTPTDVLRLEEGAELTVALYLEPKPLELDPLSVSAERIRNELELQGFYDRRERGRGFFLTPEALRARPPVTEAEVIARAPFVEINRSWTGSTITMRESGRTCRPVLYVDNFEVRGGNVEDHVNSADIIAIEVYRGVAEIPHELAVGWQSCGVVMIWTVWSEMRRKKIG